MDVTPEIWKRLFAAGAERRFRTGDVLLRQGDPPTHVLLLVSGRVKVTLALPDQEMLLAVRWSGELLGEIAVLGGEGERRSSSVIALDPCSTRVLTADRFRRLMRETGGEVELLKLAMRRIREGEAWRAEIATLPAGPRVVRALLRLAAPGGVGPANVGLGQAEIGQAVGLSRSVVAAELAELRERGLITTARRRVVITDLSRLRELAGQSRGSV